MCGGHSDSYVQGLRYKPFSPKNTAFSFRGKKICPYPEYDVHEESDYDAHLQSLSALENTGH